MKITISVPKPCHENWEVMTPKAQGRHCAQCDHVVADLTNATDAQLLALFTSDAKPKCARFDPLQLDRALGAAEQQSHRRIPVAAFTSLLAVAAGHEAVAQQGVPMMVGEPAIAQPPPPPPLVTGKMMFVPAPEDSIPKCSTLLGDTIAVVIPDPDPILERTEIGDVKIQVEGVVKGEMQLVADAPLDPGAVANDEVPTSDPRDDEGPLGITGFVEDVRTGKMLPQAIIQLRGTSVRVHCNDRGYFGLRVPSGVDREALVLDVYVPGSGEIALPLPPKGTPFYAPIKFQPDVPSPLDTLAQVELPAVIIVREREKEFRAIGGACVVTYQVPPTLWQRIIAPVKRGWNNLRH
jgi:hypothetical protein